MQITGTAWTVRGSIAICLLTLCLSFGAQSANEAEATLAESIDAFMLPLAADGFTGIVEVYADQIVLFRGAYGYANCANTEPLTVDHLMMIGSITKEFTQLLGYQLAADELLGLDDTIDKYIDDLPVTLSQISIRQLISHTAGLPDLIDAAGQPVPYTVEYDYLPVSRNELLRRFRRVSLISQPGGEEEYSNLGYNILAAIYEIATGTDYAELLRIHVFRPAGMETMDYVFANAGSLKFADGCRSNNERWGSPINDQMWDETGPSWNLKGAGGLLGRADDLVRFFGALGGGDLMDDATQKSYLDDRLVFVRSLNQRAMGPAGSNGIFNAVAYWAETADLRVVVLSSRADHAAESFADKLIGLVARHPAHTVE